MPTVLVADPNPTFAAVIADALERQAGVTVSLAASGPEALDRAAASFPDLVVLDGALPQCGLADLTGTLRLRHPDLPVVLMPVGVDAIPPTVEWQGILHKPFFLPDLTTLVMRLLDLSPGRPVGWAHSGATGVLKPATAPLPAPPVPRPPLSDAVRRQVESQVEQLSHALRDEPVFLSQGERVWVIAPRVSPTAAAALGQVVGRAWHAPDAAPEVIRFEGTTEINRYMLYSVGVPAAPDLKLSVALRARIPLPIVRRAARSVAAALAELLTAR